MIAAAISHHMWATREVARNNSNRKTQRPHVSQEPHMDVNVNAKQVMSPAILLQLATMIGAGAVIYSTMVANDREHATAITQLQRDMVRIEKDQKDLKVEILGELRELRTELRERQKGK